MAKINSAFGPKCPTCSKPLRASVWPCIFCKTTPVCTNCYDDHVSKEHPEQYTPKEE